MSDPTNLWERPATTGRELECTRTPFFDYHVSYRSSSMLAYLISVALKSCASAEDVVTYPHDRYRWPKKGAEWVPLPSTQR